MPDSFYNHVTGQNFCSQLRLLFFTLIGDRTQQWLMTIYHSLFRAASVFAGFMLSWRVLSNKTSVSIFFFFFFLRMKNFFFFFFLFSGRFFFFFLFFFFIFLFFFFFFFYWSRTVNFSLLLSSFSGRLFWFTYYCIAFTFYVIYTLFCSLT